MIYLVGVLLIANFCSGVIALIVGNLELLRHNEIVVFLLLILIVLKTKKEK